MGSLGNGSGQQTSTKASVDLKCMEAATELDGSCLAWCRLHPSSSASNQLLLVCPCRGLCEVDTAEASAALCSVGQQTWVSASVLSALSSASSSRDKRLHGNEFELSGVCLC